MANEPHVAPIMAKLPDIRAQIVAEVAISAINTSNAERAGISQADIDALEAKWQEELNSGSYTLIASVTENVLGAHLRSVVDGSDGLITEINVMDANGLSIAQSSMSSDIWQGDESKYQKSYVVGPDAVFVDEVELDGSTQTFQSQANFTVVDPATGQPIGAVSVGIDVGKI
jgi:hypothetical protein